MTLDQRARAAGDAVSEELAALVLPEPRSVVRRATRRRRIAGGLGAMVLLAAAGLGWRVLADDGPAGTPLAVGDSGAPGWTRIQKADAGLAEGSSLDAVASDGEDAVLVGAVPGDEWWQTAIWFSEDGRTWHRAEHPEGPGSVFAVDIHDGVAVAVGSRSGPDDPTGTNFVWRSEDGGRTWIDSASGPDLFGPAAPEMGRPFASQVVFRDGWWIASGGSSTGFAGIWVSRTGEAWEQVLESREGGSVALVDLDDGRLMAYSGDTTWVTDDPTAWGRAQQVDIPPDRFPDSIAAGAHLAVGNSYQSHLDRQLLRSTDEGRTWTVDEAFAQQFPGELLTTAAAFGDVEIVSGADRQSRPTAWISVAGGPWQTAPVPLREPPGGVLILVTEIDGQIVLLGTAPELDRFYFFRP